MKFIKIKSIEIWSDGTIYFSQKNLQSIKQVIFYEKNIGISPFFKKIRKKQSVQYLQQNSYKSKYKL